VSKKLYSDFGRRLHHHGASQWKDRSGRALQRKESPRYDHIDDETERAELIFLPFAITLPQFAPFTAENDAQHCANLPRSSA